jgi:hypothetical protein
MRRLRCLAFMAVLLLCTSFTAGVVPEKKINQNNVMRGLSRLKKLWNTESYGLILKKQRYDPA